MIEYIIYDETKEEVNKLENEIDKIMINYDLDYKKYSFSTCEDKLKQKIKEDKFKIYILNQTNISKSGLLVAKEIRKEDWKSIIIFISNTSEYKVNILTKRLYILDYILSNELKELNKLLEISLKIYDTRPKELKYKYKNIQYNIPYKDIIYIEKEQDNKRSIIHTASVDYLMPSNLTSILSKLDDRFLKCSRTYIINLEQVLSYNKKDNIIKFNDNSEIYEISRNIKSELINRLRNVD